METETPQVSFACLDDLANTEESRQEFGQTILDAFRELRDSHRTVAAEVFVFTDRTEGHYWRIQMRKTGVPFSAFRFAGFHKPPPCSVFCEPAAEELLASEHLHLVYRKVGGHIAAVANGHASPSRKCEDFCANPRESSE